MVSQVCADSVCWSDVFQTPAAEIEAHTQNHTDEQLLSEYDSSFDSGTDTDWP